MKTVATLDVRQHLVGRLNALGPETRRHWGTLTPHEMLCHLGDAAEMVLGTRPRTRPIRVRRRPWVKWLWLWGPVPWPHGLPTNPLHNPRVDGTRPSDFEKDRTRVIRTIESIGAARPRARLEPGHGLFGSMSVRDWQRWAYRHTDYHLRQFGL